MKLVVLGATGGMGLQIVRQAIEHGHAVTAFVGSPERLMPFRNRIRITEGNLLNSGDLEQAIEGHDADLSGFLIVFAFVVPALYALTAIGLFYRLRFAGFLAWFIFIGPGVAEFTHFIFPLLRPAIYPEIPQRVSHLFPSGVYISQLPNYYVRTTGTYYFAGIYTAILPMIPGICAIYRLLKEDRQRKAFVVREDQKTSASIGGGPYVTGVRINADGGHGQVLSAEHALKRC